MLSIPNLTQLRSMGKSHIAASQQITNSLISLFPPHFKLQLSCTVPLIFSMISSPDFSNLKSTGFRYQNRSKTHHTVTCIATTAAPLHTVLTLYGVLGIKSGATCHEIKAAYRHLVRECHPDIVEDDQKSQSANEFIRIHDAHATLSDPDKKAHYDRNMMVVTTGRSRRNSPNRKSAYSRSPRNWETDQCW
jgi:DnaJ domain